MNKDKVFVYPSQFRNPLTRYKYRKVRSRRSASSIRTIIQLNNKQKSVNIEKIDPKINWSQKKCHKYAMFKVK